MSAVRPNKTPNLTARVAVVGPFSRTSLAG